MSLSKMRTLDSLSVITLSSLFFYRLLSALWVRCFQVTFGNQIQFTLHANVLKVFRLNLLVKVGVAPTVCLFLVTFMFRKCPGLQKG